MRRSQAAAPETTQLRLLRARRFGAAVAAREFLHSPGSVDELLLAGKERMTSGADTNLDVLLRRARVVNRPAGAGNFGLVVVRMNVRFHGLKRSMESRRDSGTRKRGILLHG